jgi:hypothetical protein
MNAQTTPKITAYLRCTIAGNGVELNKVYPTSGKVLTKAAVICYYLVDLEQPVPAAQFTIDAVVSNK